MSKGLGCRHFQDCPQADFFLRKYLPLPESGINSVRFTPPSGGISESVTGISQGFGARCIAAWMAVFEVICLNFGHLQVFITPSLLSCVWRRERRGRPYGAERQAAGNCGRALRIRPACKREGRGRAMAYAVPSPKKKQWAGALSCNSDYLAWE